MAKSHNIQCQHNHTPDHTCECVFTVVHSVRRYSCTVYIVVVVCNVSSLYKSQEHRLSRCCSTTLQPATSCVKYIIIFGQIILIFSRRGLGPTSFRADNSQYSQQKKRVSHKILCIANMYAQSNPKSIIIKISMSTAMSFSLSQSSSLY